MGSIADKFNTFKRRSSGPQTDPGTAAGGASAGHSPPDARRGAAAPLMLAGSGLSAGRYILEVDAAGAIKSLNPLHGSGSGESGGEADDGGGGPPGARRHSSTGSGEGALAAGELQVRLLRQQREIAELRAQLAKLSATSGGGGGDAEGAGAAAASAVVEAALAAADARAAAAEGGEPAAAADAPAAVSP
jgi:hypothetical protein